METPKRAANSDKERIAELERERDRLLKELAELRDRLTKLEAEQRTRSMVSVNERSFDLALRDANRIPDATPSGRPKGSGVGKISARKVRWERTGKMH